MKWTFGTELQARYKISYADYEAKWEAQKGKCAICGIYRPCAVGTRKTKRLCVDHCHRTNKFRGLICDSCNKLLGFAKDRPGILFNAIRYLKTYE